MIRLERFYLDLALVCEGGLDAFGGRLCSCSCRNVGNLVFDGRLAYVGVVILAALAGRRVDDELDLLVVDGVDYVWPAFVDLLDVFALDAVPAAAVQ